MIKILREKVGEEQAESLASFVETKIKEEIESKKEGFATKKQLVVARKKAERMTETLGGITELKKLPDALFIIDIVREHNAVKEAIKLHIPVIAVVDSNADPELVDYCIPGNDDAVKAIQLYLKEIASEINKHKPKIAEENAEAKNEN